MPSINRFTDAAINAKDLTNKQLADLITTHSSFTRDALQQLLPNKTDKEAFVQLIAEVDADTTADEKLAFLTNNIETVGGVALKILKVLV